MIKMNFNFLPLWYMKNTNGKTIKKFKIAIVIFLAVDMCLLYLMHMNRNRLNILDENIKEKIYLCSKNYSSYSEKDSNISTETYHDFLDQFSKYGKFRNININNKNIDLEFVGENSLFLNFIRAVEYGNKFNIISISYLKDGYEVELDKNSEGDFENSNKKVWKVELKHV